MWRWLPVVFPIVLIVTILKLTCRVIGYWSPWLGSQLWLLLLSLPGAGMMATSGHLSMIFTFGGIGVAPEDRSPAADRLADLLARVAAVSGFFLGGLLSYWFLHFLSTDGFSLLRWFLT